MAFAVVGNPALCQQATLWDRLSGVLGTDPLRADRDLVELVEKRLDVCQLISLTRAVQARLAALVAQLRHKVDTDQGEAPDAR